MTSLFFFSSQENNNDYREHIQFLKECTFCAFRKMTISLSKFHKWPVLKYCIV